MATEASSRIATVQAHIQAEELRSLKILAFRDVLAQLRSATTDADRVRILNKAWQDRDLFEFWNVQFVLSEAAHIATVDNYLSSQQGILSLLVKDVARAAQGPAHAVDDWLHADPAKPEAASQPTP